MYVLFPNKLLILLTIENQSVPHTGASLNASVEHTVLYRYPSHTGDQPQREGMGLLEYQPGNASLAWYSSWRMILYIYYIIINIFYSIIFYSFTAARNSISSQLGSSWHGYRYGTKKAGAMASPSRTKLNLPGHSPTASQAGRRVGLALYCIAFGLIDQPHKHVRSI